MYEIYFYEDENGNSPIYNYIQALSQRTDKDNRINYIKINDYIQVLSEYGKAAGEPYIKHIDGDIWELRPIRGRIFFAGWTDNGFILLHHFIKKTQKTPMREIERAKRNLQDIRDRSGQQ
jgi:phage-related protein